MLKEKNSELFERIHELVNNPTSLNSPSFLEELEYSQKSLTSGYSSNLSLLDELDSDEAITMLPVDNFSQVSYVRTHVDVKLYVPFVVSRLSIPARAWILTASMLGMHEQL